jgi:hypothetical protein
MSINKEGRVYYEGEDGAEVTELKDLLWVFEKVYEKLKTT